MDGVEDQLSRSAGWMVKIGRSGLPVVRRAVVVRAVGEDLKQVKVQASRSSYGATERIARSDFALQRFGKAVEELARQDRAINLGRRMTTLSGSTDRYLTSRGIGDDDRPGDRLTALTQAWHADWTRHGTAVGRFAASNGQSLAGGSIPAKTNILSPRVKRLIGNALSGRYASGLSPPSRAGLPAGLMPTGLDSRGAPMRPLPSAPSGQWPAEASHGSGAYQPEARLAPASLDQRGWSEAPLVPGQRFTPPPAYRSPPVGDQRRTHAPQDPYQPPLHLPQPQRYDLPPVDRSVPQDAGRQSPYLPPQDRGAPPTHLPQQALVERPAYPPAPHAFGLRQEDLAGPRPVSPIERPAYPPPSHSFGLRQEGFAGLRLLGPVERVVYPPPPQPFAATHGHEPAWQGADQDRTFQPDAAIQDVARQGPSHETDPHAAGRWPSASGLDPRPPAGQSARAR